MATNNPPIPDPDLPPNGGWEPEPPINLSPIYNSIESCLGQKGFEIHAEYKDPNDIDTITSGSVGKGFALVGDKVYETSPISFKGKNVQINLEGRKIKKANVEDFVWEVRVVAQTDQTRAAEDNWITSAGDGEIEKSFSSPLATIKTGWLSEDNRRLLNISTQESETAHIDGEQGLIPDDPQPVDDDDDVEECECVGYEEEITRLGLYIERLKNRIKQNQG